MGQSNSTSPLLITQSNEVFKDFDYSRLILSRQGQSGSLPSVDLSFLSKKMPVSYFRLNRFQSLNGDDLLVKDRQQKVSERFESQRDTTFKNISNLKLVKQSSSIRNSKLNITSIARLQLPTQQHIGQSKRKRGKPSHIKFHSSHRLVCKNYIIQKSFSEDKKKFSTKILNYFVQEQDMENYVSNLIKLKQVLMDLDLYQDFSILQEDGLYIIERHIGGEIDFTKGKLNKYVLRDNVPLLLDYLCFLAKVYTKIDDIYIDPEDVFFDNHQFYLIDFKYKELHPFEMILATLEWIFKSVQSDPNRLIEQKIIRISQPNKNQKTLEQSFLRKDELQNASFFPLYIRELWKNLVQKKIERHELLPYITRLKCKASTLSMKIDSFHACIQHKKTWMFQEEKHGWILGKKCNQVYFYNINDDHRCHVKVVRKKKKIDLSQIKIVFDPEELQIKYIAENSKLVIHISEFQMQKSSCLSDIEIKYRLPIKFKSPFIFYNNKRQQIFILQNCVYKYSIVDNKMLQQTKKISESIFLARSYDCGYIVIKLSIDIFKNGIKVFINQTEIDLYFVGEEKLLEEVSNIRVDIKMVDFCKQVYKGVYLMLANRNMWILDLNFNVFYSFATIERVKQFYGFALVANTAGHPKSMHHHHHHQRNQARSSESNNLTDYAFEIFNQPFKAEFLTYQQGLHAKIKDDQLHIIGQIQGNMYYLNYLFMPEAGSLKLLSYKPLFGVQLKIGSTGDIGTKKSCSSDQSIDVVKKDKTKKVKIAEETIEFDMKSNAQTSTLQVHNQPKQPTLSVNLKPPNENLLRRRSRQMNELSIMKFLKQPSFDVNNYQFYHFNFHQENLPSYKNDSWLFFNESFFIKAQDFFLKTNKTNYKIQLKIKKSKYSLKDLIEKIKKSNENKSFKERKSISKEECLFYMLRCLQIYEWLIQNELDHRNISIGNLYFMEADNALKLIGWSEPPRNWYVSDFKDLLLVYFNIITCNSFEKLNQKVLFNYKTQLQQFPLIYEKMQIAFKLMKVSQKKSEIEKEIKEIRQSLLKELTNRFILGQNDEKSLKNIGITSQRQLAEKQRKELAQINSNEFIFNFEYNTPRFSMVSTLRKKMKKMKCLIDQNSKEQLIFKPTDKYLWNQEKGSLYMFTTTYQFYQIQINTQSFKQEALVCQEYEYLPNNIVESSLIFVPSHGIISIGGIYKAKDTQLTFNRTVYKFNFEKLTWDTLGEIPEPRVNAYVILSKEGREIYCIGGQTEHSSQNMHILRIDLSQQNHQSQKIHVQLLVDPLPFNPISQVLASYPSRIYNISSELQLFVLFAITPEKYLIRLFSLNSFCLDMHLDAKNYSDDNKIISSTVGITLNKGTIHVLRQYGKYSKICLNKLENLTVINETVYPQRQDKVEG